MAESVERRGGARAAAGHSSVTLSAVQCREWREWRSAEVQKCRRVHNIFSEKSPDTVAAAAAAR